eukprot:Phypoly_transcript_14225.p1 GENE.Phypoly_transcript_14225~~Phypoly_transcript_14225.p1  ORF type:complete len:274 (+),score=35.03 Phypoly_transcript_14225:100-921(+)
MATSTRMPVVYLNHGLPTYFLSQPITGNPLLTEFRRGSETHLSLERIPKEINAHNPTAVVIISAHWNSHKVQISAPEKSSIYYDFGGFPREAYEIEYPAPTNPELARKISSLLASHGIENELNEKRGWDHGVFVPMKVMYPDANIPVVAMSLDHSLDTKLHLKIGKALAPLREQGVLIIGSGSIVHEFDDAEANVSFVDTVDRAVTSLSPSERETAFENWRDFKGQDHDHTGTCHFLPLLIAVGAAGEDKGTVAFRRDFYGGHVVTCNYYFGL